MNKKRLYVIPHNDPIVAARLVTQISGCSHVSGWLEVPARLVSDLRAVAHTGFYLHRFHDIRPTIKTVHPMVQLDGDNAARREDKLARETEGLTAIMCGLRAGFVEFDQAGYENRPMPCDNIVATVVNLLLDSYTGIVRFNYGHLHRDDEEWITDAEVALFAGGIRGHEPAHNAWIVGIATLTEHGEQLPGIAHLTEYCQGNFNEVAQFRLAVSNWED